MAEVFVVKCLVVYLATAALLRTVLPTGEAISVAAFGFPFVYLGILRPLGVV